MVGTLDPTELPTILLAEDDEDMRRLVVSALTEDGYRVREVANGAELLALLANVTAFDRPDAIISDVLMPRYSGLDILAAVRRAGWNTPVILITAHRDEQLRAKAADLGVTAFLNKPIDMADLRVAVLKALRMPRRVAADDSPA